MYKPRYLYISVGASHRLDERVDETIKLAKDMNTVVLVDVAYTEPQAVKTINRVLHLPDIVHLNTEELYMLTGEDDILKALAKIKDKAPTLICVTCGKKGVIALYNRKYIVIQPPFHVELKDPTGADDAFCAGLLSALKVSGKNLGELSIDELSRILMYAQASGAIAVTTPGATTAVSSLGVRKLVDEQGGGILERTKFTELSL